MHDYQYRKVDGAEVVQVYVSCTNGRVFRPKKELKGFAKVFLKAGESKSVTVALDDRAFRYIIQFHFVWK